MNLSHGSSWGQHLLVVRVCPTHLSGAVWLQVIVFLRKKDKFISLLLKHIGTSALMDLLLRLVSCVEPAGLRQEVLHVSVWAPSSLEPLPVCAGSAHSPSVE